MLVTPANEHARAQAGKLAEQVQSATQRSVRVAYMARLHRRKAAIDAAAHGIELEVVKRAEASHGFVLLSRSWVIERSFTWLAGFRQLSRDHERFPTTLAGLRRLALSCLLLSNMPKATSFQPSPRTQDTL